MKNTQTICLLNDSFPPLIDGVANAVMNYAQVLRGSDQEPIVITPSLPEAEDYRYPYEIIRYPSIDLRSTTGYMAGIPFAPEVFSRLSNRKVSLLHTHCPIVSAMLGRELRQVVDAPLVLTYHTKFDIDIANLIKSHALQDIGKHALLENINACDEVWAVSRGAADNLRSLGYEGECIIMQNGVDLPLERVTPEAVHQAVQSYDLPENVPVFLFVGRIMWYKGLKIILDALSALHAEGIDFRMVFIGGGSDLEDVQSYSAQNNLGGKCIFTGPIHDRDTLRAWYCRSNLFLFPSTFDTNGLVVREAAACSLASVLIAGSCASEGVTDCQNGFLIEENAASLHDCLKNVINNPALMAQVGINAGRELYISWETAVQNAMQRYEVVIDRYNSGAYPIHHQPIDNIFKASAELMEGLSHLQTVRHHMQEQIADHLEDFRSHLI